MTSLSYLSEKELLIFHKEILIDELTSRVTRHSKRIKYLGKYCGGIYVLWNKDDIVYVGQTKNLQNRLHQHKDDHPNWKWNYLSFIEEKNQADRVIVEAMLIKRCHPTYNINCNDNSCIDN